MLDLLLFGQKTAPDFFWDARGGVLPPGATCTRASAARSFNSAGVQVSSGNNVARFDYDPATLTPLGFLAEMQSANGVLQSDDFSNAAWTSSGQTPTGGQANGPDGTATLAKLLESNTNVAHKVSQAITLASATTAGFSFFVRASTRSKFYISLQASSGNYATAVFDTAGAGTTASETSVGGTSGTISTTNIRALGGGLYRCSMQAMVTGANPTLVFGLASLASGNTFSATGDVTYAGDGASFGYAGCAQFDTAGVGVTSYIPTAGSGVTRAADLLTLPLTSLPGWNASKGGVLVVANRLHTLRPSARQTAVGISDVAGNNFVELSSSFGGTAGNDVWSGGIRQTLVSGAAAPSLFARTKVAGGWGASRIQIASDGAAPTANAGAYALPVSPANLYVGNIVSSDCLNGTIESIAYYAGARSDAFVQQVSR